MATAIQMLVGITLPNGGLIIATRLRTVEL
jgi:hypothetical protein